MNEHGRWRVGGLLTALVLVGGSAACTPAQAQGHQILIGATSSSSSYEVQALHRWVEAVTERTDGEVSIRVLADGQLGKELETVESIVVGDVQGISGGLIGLPEWDFLASPYVARDREHMRDIVDGDIAEGWKQEWLDNTGIEMIGLLERLPRTLTANREIRDVDGVRGLNVRVPETDFHIGVWREVGAKPTAIPSQEVYAALASEVVDGQENTLDSSYAFGIDEVQDYVILTEHNMLPQVVGVQTEVLDSLGETNREIVLEEMAKAEQWLADELVVAYEEIVADLEASGMTVIEPDIDSFREGMLPTTERFADEIWGPGVFEEVQGL